MQCAALDSLRFQERNNPLLQPDASGDGGVPRVPLVLEHASSRVLSAIFPPAFQSDYPGNGKAQD